MRPRYLSAATLTAVLLGGCTGPNVPTTVETTGMPNAELALQNTIKQVDRDMAQIGGLTPATPIAAETALPDELKRLVDFEWNGALDGAVRKLAETIGYRCVIARPASLPKLPVTLHMNARAIDILKRLGDEAGQTATVSVDPQHHKIQVMYHA